MSGIGDEIGHFKVQFVTRASSICKREKIIRTKIKCADVHSACGIYIFSLRMLF